MSKERVVGRGNIAPFPSALLFEPAFCLEMGSKLFGDAELDGEIVSVQFLSVVDPAFLLSVDGTNEASWNVIETWLIAHINDVCVCEREREIIIIESNVDELMTTESKILTLGFACRVCINELLMCWV